MADVSLHCLSCSKTLTVSQFADHTKLSCPDCGSNMSLAAPVESHELQRPDLQIRHNRPPAAMSKSDEPTQADLMQKVFMPGRGIVRKRRMSGSIKQVIAAWLLFLALGTAMFFLRYRDIVPDPIPAYVKEYGPYLIGLLHITIIIYAFRDHVLQGILCMLVPFYTLYYLMVADMMFLRAVTLGLLVGLGQDTFELVSGYWMEFFRTVDAWIREGGR